MKVIAAFAVLAVLGTATALDCFNCNSEADSACNDDFNYDSPALKTAFIQTCEAKGDDEPFCRKVKYYIERVNNATEYRVQRDCGYKRREGFDCYQKRSEDYVMDTCQCDGNLCNGVPALATSMATMFTVAVPLFARFL